MRMTANASATSTTRATIFREPITLTTSELRMKGWAYQFDLTQLPDTSEQAIREHVRSVYYAAIDAITRARSIKIRKGPFYLWLSCKPILGDRNEYVDGFALIITPFFQNVTGRDSDPVVQVINHYAGYLRMESAYPLLEGAMPICVYVDEQVTYIDVTDELFTKLATNFDDHQSLLAAINPGMPMRDNPYPVK